MRPRKPDRADASRRSEIVSLREENSTLLARIDALEMALEESKQNEDDFRANSLQLQIKCASLASDVQTLSRQLQTAVDQKRATDATLSGYIDRQESHNAEREKLHRKVIEAQQRWQTAQENLIASTRQWQVLKEENAAAQDDAEQQRLQCDKLGRENDSLRQQLGELTRMSKELLDFVPQVARMRENCQELQHEKATADHEIEALRAKVRRANRDNVRLRREIRSKEILSAKRQKMIAELQAEVDQLRSSFGDASTAAGIEDVLGEVHRENEELGKFLATRKKLEGILTRVNESIANFSSVREHRGAAGATLSAAVEEEEEEDADERSRAMIRDDGDETSELKAKASGSGDAPF
jgi:chromosome segregation ATPase